jgi:hypothetical protein
VKRGRPPVWKLCPTCWRKKRIAEDFYHWTDEGSPRMSAQCKVCIRAIRRERYREVVADPYLQRRLRERQNEWAQRVDQRENAERCKRYREKLKRERPEVYQQQLEDARIRGRLRNDRLNKPPGIRRAEVIEPHVAPLPVAPLLAFLNRLGTDVLGVSDRAMPKDVARAIHRAKTENREHVTVAVADRIITAYGGALSTVYPELFA